MITHALQVHYAGIKV